MSRPDDYQKCIDNGWGVGTRLVGDEGYGPTTIELTYISRQNILAVTIDAQHKYLVGGESSWTLSCRDWKEVAR